MRTPAFIFGAAASLLLAGCNTVAVERSVVVDTVAAPAPYPVAPAPYPVTRAPYPVAPAPYPVRPAPLPPESCYADDADWALGARASARVVERATFESGARTARVIQPGEFYTQEYRPDRLNIHVDPRGRIVDLRCG